MAPPSSTDMYKALKNIGVTLLALSLVIFVMPKNAEAAPAYVQKVEAGNSSSGDTLVLNSVAAGSVIVIGWSNRTLSNINSSVTVNDSQNGAFTIVGEQTGSTAGGFLYLVNASAGTHTMTVTYTGDAFQLFWVAAEYSGVSSTPFDQSATNKLASGATASTGTTGTLAQASELVVAFVAIGNNNGSIAGDAPTTLRTGTTGAYALGDDNVNATTAVSRSFTINSTTYSGFIATFKAPSTATSLPATLTVWTPVTLNTKMSI